MMRRKISRKIVAWTKKYHPLEKEGEEEIVCYGVEMFLDNMGTMFFLFLGGLIIGKGMETLTTLAVFALLRSQAGGIHCKEKWQCRSCMVMITAISVLIPKIFSASVTTRSFIYLLILGILYRKAPANGKRIMIEDKEVQKRKKYFSYLIVLLVSFISLFVTDQLATAWMTALMFEGASLVVKR